MICCSLYQNPKKVLICCLIFVLQVLLSFRNVINFSLRRAVPSFNTLYDFKEQNINRRSEQKRDAYHPLADLHKDRGGCI